MTVTTTVGPIVDFDPARRTNAQAIAELAQLGILRPEHHVLDMTIGPKRGFWKLWKPHRLTTNDLDRKVQAQHHHDGTELPFPARSFDVAVWDPPYANRGTARRELDERFGTTDYTTPVAVENRLVDGTVEALRVSRRLVLVKCQDGRVASTYRPQSFLVWDAARKHGARLIAEMYVVGRREQPAGKKQAGVWTSCSTLMVFEKAWRSKRG